MVVGDDDSVQRTGDIWSRQDTIPVLSGFVVRQPGIDRGPVLAVAQQPQIDVIQCERQGKVSAAGASATCAEAGLGISSCQLFSKRAAREA
jgi:hypothetical protein